MNKTFNGERSNESAKRKIGGNSSFAESLSEQVVSRPKVEDTTALTAELSAVEVPADG